MPRLHGVFEFRFVKPDWKGDGRTWEPFRIGEVRNNILVSDTTIEAQAAHMDAVVDNARRTIASGQHLPGCMKAKRASEACGCMERLEYLQGKTRQGDRTMLVKITVS